MSAVMYCRNGCHDSEVMREYLSRLGIEATVRPVDGDDGARREWEDLDGQVTPLLVIDQKQIVRGMDRARIDQLVGFIGC